MKIEKQINRKLRYGSASLGIVAAVIAAVLLLNILATFLFSENRWFIDMTTEPIYTLSDEARDLLETTVDEVNAKRDKPAQIKIIFCADPDLLCANTMMRYIYYTALALENTCPESITVETHDIIENPSAVAAYRANSHASIYPSYVIVASGEYGEEDCKEEYRVYTHKAFFSYFENATTPMGYSGEKTFLKGIISVTRAEAPICALTTNHGEPFATEEGRAEYSGFLSLIEEAGYNIAYLNLATDEIPADCRLIITFDPQTDFVTGSGEAAKLEAFLDDAKSYMVFADADTPRLINMEEYLEEWGIAFERYNKNATYEMTDPEHSVDAEGKTLIAEYETQALGGSLTQDMREKGNSPMVIFGNALSIGLSKTYLPKFNTETDENGMGKFSYGYIGNNNHTRRMYDIFRAKDTAYAYAKLNGERVTDDSGALVTDTQGPFRLMTVTEQERLVSEGIGYTNAEMNSYVCAIGSTEFVSDAFLSTNAYGNTDLLLLMLRQIGKPDARVDLNFKELYDSQMNSKLQAQMNPTALTVVLVALPAVAFACAGVVILSRRRAKK